MKVAAFQSPLPTASFSESIDLVRTQVEQCERQGVEILCCPEAVLGGLADNTPSLEHLAINAGGGRLEAVLSGLKTDRVTLIIGFTERSPSGELFNAAAIYGQGIVSGIYRKQHPAIRSSVYTPGQDAPVFTVGGLTFGILICNDSNFTEPAQSLVTQGAKALFIPTNNALPADREDVSDLARQADAKLAIKHGVTIIRADVAGDSSALVSYGSTEIVAPDGTVLAAAQRLTTGMIASELPLGP